MTDLRHFQHRHLCSECNVAIHPDCTMCEDCGEAFYTQQIVTHCFYQPEQATLIEYARRDNLSSPSDCEMLVY